MAPLSNAERQKRYRERLKQNNPEKFEEKRKAHLEKVKHNKKKQSELNENEKKKQREKWKKYSAKYYNKQKKQKNDEPTEDPKIKKIHKKFRQKLRKLQNEITESMEIAKIHIKENRRLRKQVLRLQKKAVTTSQNMHNTHLVDKQCCLSIESCNHKAQTDPKLTISTIDALTPKKKTELFIDSLSSVNEEEKNKLKKKILDLNVLTESLTQNYGTATKTEKRTLKKIVMNRFTSKYKIVTRLSKICTGLVGKIRKSGNMINRRRKMRIEEIHNFYNRDDVSRATAGKKETKSKNKEKVQRRYLLDTVKNLHKKYKENGGKASYSSFLRHRPFYVLTPKLNDCDTCACIKHANFQFKIDKLFKTGIIKTNNISDIMKEFSCDLNSKACMYNECGECCSKAFNLEDNQDFTAKITWKQWCLKKVLYKKKDEEGNQIDHETKKFTREEIETTLEELLYKFQEEARSFKKHFFNNSHQQKVFRESRENIKDDEAVIICDFSENYQCRHNTEIQGMHFKPSRNQITLHTGVLYINNQKPISFCTLSPSNEHNPYSIWAHLTPILNYIKSEFPRIKTLHFFSDGPSTQYKQKLNFILFAKITKDYGFKNCTWNFFESAHGKNAADGIGGAVKRTLDSCVAFGSDIPDAETAIQVLREKSKIMLHYITDADINAIKEYLGEEKVLPLKGTMAVHQIVTTESENYIKYRDIGCLCGENRGQCMCFNIKIHCLTHSASASVCEAEASNKSKKKLTKKEEKVVVLSDVKLTEENKLHSESAIVCEAEASNKTKKKLTKKEEKVVVLSDVKLTEENRKFYKTLPLRLREIDPSTEVLCERKNMTNNCSLSTGNSINIEINYHGYYSSNEDENEKTTEPERQKERKKRRSKRASKGNKRSVKKRKLTNASTTSESADISIYSDSDVENFEDDSDRSFEETSNSTANKEFSAHIKRKSQQIKKEENIGNKIIQDEIPEAKLTKNVSIEILNKNADLQEDIGMENDIKYLGNNLLGKKVLERKPLNNLVKKGNLESLNNDEEMKNTIEMETNTQEKTLKEKKLEQEDSRKTANDLNDEDNIQELNKNEEMNDPRNEIFAVEDAVLVRYSSRKTWKYYVGVIVNITDDIYTISFYKTINIKGNVKFRKPLRLDIDKVPETLIVKKIELLQISENPYELALFHDEDSIYFT